MLAFAYYLLKVSICSGVLYGYYFLTFRNKRFHQYNRFYLLFAVVVSFVIPLARIGVWTDSTQEMPVIKLFKVVATRDAIVEESLRFWSVFSDVNLLGLLVFLLVSSAFFVWLLISMVQVAMLARTKNYKNWNNIRFVFTEAKGTPFSFFKYIFWNTNIDLQTREGKHILQHELVHVHEMHSADKLFMEIVLIVSWLNPFFWMIRKELNMIHEFIADENAISDGDTESFSAMLIKSAYPQHSFIITNSFFHSPIKRRLIMFTTSKKPSYSYLRRLMILPLLSFVIVFFSFKIKGQNSDKLPESDEISKSNIPGKKSADTSTKINFGSGHLIETTSNGQVTSNSNNIDSPALHKPLVILDKVEISWEDYTKKNISPEQIKEVFVWKDKQAIEKYGKKGIFGVLEINTKGFVDKEPKSAAIINTSDTVEAKFPGGDQAWKRYLETNLNASVPVVKDKAPAGIYSVKLQFIVTETGEIKDVAAIQSPDNCPSCAIEAVRVIKSGPKWEPMTINGRSVTSQPIQFISFMVAKK